MMISRSRVMAAAAVCTSRSQGVSGSPAHPPFQEIYECGLVQTRVLLVQPASGRGATAQGAQAPLAVLVREVAQRACAARAQSPLGQVEVGAVLLQRCRELLDAARRGAGRDRQGRGGAAAPR